MSSIQLHFGPVTEKELHTDNDFVSHMIEHLAWRLGCAITLAWQGTNWQELGRRLGEEIGRLPAAQAEGVALGMIDDGSAEVQVVRDRNAKLHLTAIAGIELDWFLSLRCEQLRSGYPLQALLQGLCQGLAAGISIRICSALDPHHSWEAVFRGVGDALAQIFPAPETGCPLPSPLERDLAQEGLLIQYRSATAAAVVRETAESRLRVAIDFGQPATAHLTYRGSEPEQFRGTTALKGLQQLLAALASQAGCALIVEFSTRVLSSSHVLLEDSGLVIGRALREILVRRMIDFGVNATGSSLLTARDLQAPLALGISVEGRKFLQLVPFTQTREQLYRQLILGHTVAGGLFSEDLDDFLDGLCWGLGCSMVLHCRQPQTADLAWPQVFALLGTALARTFIPNPNRRGVPAGVKAGLH
jgi:imidazoleglycerol phosphate dehydratase HisB